MANQDTNEKGPQHSDKIFLMDQWKDLLLSVFGKKSLKQWKTVTIDIMLVDHGIKQAYLFDQWSCSHSQLVCLITNLSKLRLTHNCLGILSVGLDLFIYSPDSFQSGESSISTTFIVDVSASLDQPIMMDGTTTERFKATYEVFHDFSLSQCPSQKINENTLKDSMSSIPNYEMKVSDHVNPSSLFGLTLGYPFVYWYDTEKGDDNCLSLQSLRLYMVKASERHSASETQLNSQANLDHSDNSFKLKKDDLEERLQNLSLTHSTSENKSRSCSSKLRDKEDRLADGEQVRERESYSGNKDHLSYPLCKPGVGHHVIFSFTVPENILTTALETHVQNWFSRWFSTVPWSSLFSHVWLEDSSVEPQAVCL